METTGEAQATVQVKTMGKMVIVDVDASEAVVSVKVEIKDPGGKHLKLDMKASASPAVPHPGMGANIPRAPA